MHPSVRSINIFVNAVETKSFAATARALLIDPAAVSRAIKSLEGELGVVLFVRSTRVLKLTEEGARFYRDCIQILRKLTEATQRFRGDARPPHGRLSIGMAPGISRRMLLDAISLFQQQYPLIEIVLVSVDEAAEVGEKGIDVLIRTRSLRQRGGQHPEPQGLVVRRLYHSPWIVCASPAYLEREGAPRTPSELVRHACIVSISLESDVQNEWQFVKSNVRQSVKIVSNLLIQGVDAHRYAGLAGCGIIRLGAWSVEDEIRSRKLAPVLPDWECTGTRPVVAIYRKTRPMLPQVGVFVRHLTEEFRRYSLPFNLDAFRGH